MVWFGITLDVDDNFEVRSLVQNATVADAAGNASLTLSGPVSTASIWASVDLATGAYVLGAPGTFVLQNFPIPPGSIVAGDGTTPPLVLDPADFIHVLVVRPGQGAWTATAGRGGVSDLSDPSSDFLSFAFTGLQALTPADAAPPTQAAPTDLVLVARPRSMQIGVNK